MQKFPERQEFFSKYNLPDNILEITGLEWKQLEEIFYSYQELIPKLEPISKDLITQLEKVDEVNSLRTRIKDPEHLIEKIIRKKTKEPKREINIDNYSIEITDLIGIRVLHLFKDDWRIIFKFISDNFILVERPTAYIRKGDSGVVTEEYKSKDLEVKLHPQGYRSIHYLIKRKTEKQPITAEVQVRTIFEEAWSEIDHRLRYPYKLDNYFLTQQLLVLNRLAGSADELATGIQDVENLFEQHRETIKNLSGKLNQHIDKCPMPDDEKENFRGEIKKIPLLSKPVMSLRSGEKTGTIVANIDKPSVSLTTGSDKDINYEFEFTRAN